MKKLTLLLCLTIFSCAPTKSIPKENFAKEVIIEDLNGNKNELFIQANSWMVDTFNSAESVIEFSDKESGTLLGKYLLKGSLTSGGFGVTNDTRIFCKIDIRLKDNAAKINIQPLSDIYTFYENKETRTINEKIQGLIDNFKAAINVKQKDW